MQKSIIFLFINFVALNIFSQDTTIFSISGKILDIDTKRPIPATYVINVSRNFAVQADTAGYYKILMKKGDDIQVRSIGYYKMPIVPDFSQIEDGNITQNIFMKKQIYNIGTVNIYSVRWNGFVYDIKNTEPPDDEVRQKVTKWLNDAVEQEDLALVNAQSGFRLPIFTHYEKQMKQLEKYKKIEELNKKAQEKFNKDLVSKITGLTDGDLDEFMKYCQFDRDFILATPEYDLIIIIQNIYDEYTLNIKNK